MSEPVQPSAAPKNERKPFVRRECLCGHSISMHDLNGDKIGVCRRCACEQFNEPAQTNTVPMQPSAAPALDVEPRSIELLKKTLSTLCHFVWHRETLPGEHLWSIPPDKARDFDFIFSDVIDEVEFLRAEVARLRALQESKT